MTTVSVVIAAYNVENYIRRAIESVLSQDGIDLEVIVVDDCSKDQTVAVISALNDPRIRIIRQPQNGGPSVARNTGFAAASGQWIAVLDGDDAFAPGRLQTCLNAARATHADIVVDNLTNVYEDGRPSTRMFPVQMFNNIQTLTLARFIAGNQSFFGGTALGYLKPFFSAEFLRRHQLSYDPEIRIGEDYLILASALVCGAKCTVEHSAGYLYTVRAGSISHRLTPADVLRIQAQDQKFLSRYKLDADATRAQASRTRHIRDAYAFTLLVEAIKQKNIKGVISAIWISPLALRYLWLPIQSRLNRFYDKLMGKTS